MQQFNEQEANVWKGLVAGLAAGLVAAWTMNKFQAAWTRVTAGFEKPHGAQSMQPSEGPNPDELSGSDQAIAKKQSPQEKEDQEDATVKTAEAISEGIFGHKLTESEKKPAGMLVHYSFGTASGGLYGAMAEVAPQVTTGAGIPFGAVFWLTADEITVPLLGLAKGPTEYPVSTHVYSLASHLVYGLTAELSRRAIRQVL
jgi:putative membrane protein